MSSVEGDVHLPTYYWILKQILTLFNEPSELVLRMVHVIPFIIGLLFGIFVIQRIFKNFSCYYSGSHSYEVQLRRKIQTRKI